MSADFNETRVPTTDWQAYRGVLSRRIFAFLIDYAIVALLWIPAAVIVFFLGVLTLGLGFFLYPALFAIVAMLPWTALLVIERRHASPLAQIHDRAVTADDEAPELAEPATGGRIWRSPVAWGMALMFGMTSLITYSMFTWLPKLLVEAGGSAAMGGAMVALFSTLGLVSALTMPVLAVRMRNPFLIVLGCFVFYALAFTGLLLAPMQWPLLWVALLGMGPSTFPLALTLINLRTRTQGGSAALSGFTQGMGYSLSCLGPILFGVLHESSHGWGLPFAFLGLCALVLLFGGYLACKPRMLEDTW